MPKATSSKSQILIQRLRPPTPGEKRRRLRQRERWLKQVDLLQAFNDLFDHMPRYRVFLKRRAGEIMFVNRAMLQTLRVKDESNLIGVTDHELTPGPLADLYQARDEMVLRTGQPLLGLMEVWFTREGLPQWFTCHKLPLKNRLGKIVGIIGFLKEYNHPTQTPVHDPLNTLVDYIRSNLSHPITVEDLAELVYLSTRQVQRLFREVLGLSPKAFITKMRVHEAARLLAETDQPLSRIALNVGFSDQSALTFYFKRELGITPLKFRRAASLWRTNFNHIYQPSE